MNLKVYLTWPRVLLAASLMVVFALGVTRPVQAAVFDHDGTLAADEVINDDLLIDAENVVVDGTVNGVLLAAGKTVTVNGTINGDAILVGGNVIISDTARITGNIFAGSSTIEVSGQVDGSVFGGSASLRLNDGASVARNTYYGGYNLEVQPGATIDRDLYAGTYQTILSGEVARDVSIAAAAVRIDGKVGGNANLEVGDPSESGPGFAPFMFTPPEMQPKISERLNPGVQIADDAVIGGKLTYTSKVNQDQAIQAQPAGGVVFQTPVPAQTPEKSHRVPTATGSVFNIVFKFLQNLATLLILGFLALWLIPTLVNRTTEMASSKPATAAGYGFLSVVVGYGGAALAAIVIVMVGIFFSIVSLGGLSRTVFGVGFSGLALVVTVFSLLVVYGSKLVVAYLVGDWIMEKLMPQVGGRRYWAMVIGVVLYALLSAIPFLGWLIALVVTLIGVGAMWLVYRQWRQPPAAPAVVPAEVVAG